MNTKALFGFIGAIVIALLAISFVVASESTDLPVSGLAVTVNDVDLEYGVTDLAAAPGETVPVAVRFTSDADLRDLKVKVEAEGYKENVDASTVRFDTVNGSTYIKRLTLTFPNVQDMEYSPEGFTLHVEISDKENTYEQDYTIVLQKDSYALGFLQVDAPLRASAGEIIALDVVVKNIGGRDAQDTFVIATIPELGISKRVYFGDIYAIDNYDDTGDKDTHNEDARNGRVYLTIPADAKTGEYEIQVKASNYDAVSTVKKVISITGLTVANGTAKDLAAKDDAGIPTSIIVLTVILAIIFVVLLVVLIVLLTKKPAERIEDFGETSYY
jgi:hypothetical protein